MDIVLKRSFPWFPVVLAAGWMLMTILTVRDLAGFAVNAPGRDTVATTAEATSSTTTVKMPMA